VKEGKPLVVAMNQRHLNEKTFITDIAAEVENDRWESVKELAQAHDIST
jgi:hypothetical protein